MSGERKILERDESIWKNKNFKWMRAKMRFNEEINEMKEKRMKMKERKE